MLDPHRDLVAKSPPASSADFVHHPEMPDLAGPLVAAFEIFDRPQRLNAADSLSVHAHWLIAVGGVDPFDNPLMMRTWQSSQRAGQPIVEQRPETPPRRSDAG